MDSSHRTGRSSCPGAWSTAFIATLAALFVLVVACNPSSPVTVPATQAQQVVGPAGGTLDAGGGFRLDIPPGALAAPTTIRIEATDRAAPATYSPASPLYAFYPDGTTFAKPVQVTLPVPAGQPRPAIYWSDRASPDAYSAAGGTPSGDGISTFVDHFSTGFVGSSGTILSTVGGSLTLTPDGNVIVSAVVTQSFVLGTSVATPTGSVRATAGGVSCFIVLHQVVFGMAAGECGLLAKQNALPQRVDLAYSGDVAYAAATGFTGSGPGAPLLPSNVSFVMSPEPSAERANVTFTATVTGGGIPPAGYVRFWDENGFFQCSAMIDLAGNATCSNFLVQPCRHSYLAVYYGSALLAGSQSPLVPHGQVCPGAATCQPDLTCKTACEVTPCTGMASCQSDGTCKTACQVIPCIGAATCQPDGSCKTACEVTPCSSGLVCQPDGTCKTACQVTGCAAPATCQPDGTCRTACEVTPCTGAATCQADGTCKTACEVTPCTGSLLCQADGTCGCAPGSKVCGGTCVPTSECCPACTGAATCQQGTCVCTPSCAGKCGGGDGCGGTCPAVTCPGDGSCQADGTCGPVAYHWEGTFDTTTCTPAPPFGWRWAPPCFAVGPFGGAYHGYFYFVDGATEVVFGAGLDANRRDETLRRILALSWNSASPTLEFTIPTRYALSPDIDSSGTLRTTFTVLNHTATSLSGTFTVSTTSGYFTTDFPQVLSSWVTTPTTASGTWSATKLPGAGPRPQMNGFDFCFSNGTAYPQMSMDPASGCNPRTLPGWCTGSVLNGCTFQ